ncbi:MAG: cation:proton antiporter [Candidatus Blackburnbacteria bacterium]|nr:cation:proton antiporter [Candidatus Blackburnbacteria bacterium]
MSPFLVVSLSILSASVFGFIASLFRQPLIIGYIFAGLVLSLFGVFSGENQSLLENMAHLGITFLLFIVGLEMSTRDFRSVGKVALAAGLGQIVFTSIVGFLLAVVFGFNPVASVYIAVALTFSSTIIVVKLLSEKKDLGSLYGRITVGFLLVQDFVAVMILVFLAGFQTKELTPLVFLGVLLKGLLLVLLVYLASKTVLPKIFDKAAMISSELLFLAAISWALFLSSFVSLPQIGFSLEIGGFLAGIALANSSEHLQIASRVKPLRDFFIPIFFLLLGAKMVIGLTPAFLFPALIFSLFVLIGNPLILLGVMGALGYKSRTSFLASITVAQISEFSLIVVALGEKLGHIQSSVVGVVALVGVITMTFSTYLILNGHRLYHRLKNVLRFFERKRTKESAFVLHEKPKGHIILLGVGRTGSVLLPVLKQQKYPLLIVDFNPRVVERLTAQGFNAMYGDATDFDALELLNLEEARCVVSTTNSLEDNLVLLERIRKLPKRPVSVMTASDSLGALELYNAGASYVIVPRIVSGEHLAELFLKEELGRDHLEKLRNRHFERLARERF